MKEVIRIKDLVKKYKGVVAVNGLSLNIYEGELYSLLGENGAGKTTTVKALCDLIKTDSGDIEIFGENYKECGEKIKEKINVCPQETAIAKNLTVKENVKLIAKIYGVENQEEKTQKILEKLKLIEVQNKRAKTLSGGMQRRLSIAMALVTSPKILFLDEPTLGLDVRARRDLWDIIKKLKESATVILTTHYMEEAQELSDRVGIMAKGKLIAEGAPKDLMQKTGAKDLEDAFLKLTEESKYE